MLLGGTFTDTNTNFDPVIQNIIFEDTVGDIGVGTPENQFNIAQWYPLHPISINRFVTVDATFHQRLVVVPGQFLASTTDDDPTRGTQRLYDAMQVVVYKSTKSELDFVAPSIWRVDATPGAGKTLAFNVRVDDHSELGDDSGIMRVVVLYRNVNSNSWSRADLTYNAGTGIAQKTVVVPTTGQYEYFVQAADNAGNVALGIDRGNYYKVTVSDGPPPPVSDKVLFISPRDNGTIDGINFGAEDILAYVPNDGWVMYFDGSDVGLKTNITAFAILDDGSLIISPEKRVGALGQLRAIQAQDIVRFIPTSLGQNTAGSFEWFIDGSDVGLKGANESIASLSVDPNGRAVVGTKGKSRVPGAGNQTLLGNAGDLWAFNANQLGSGTSGTWEKYFDGADVGLGNNRITASWIDIDSGNIYLTTASPFVIGGVAYSSNDVFVCEPSSLGNNTSCAFSGFWMGENHGFASEEIYALELGTGLNLERPTGTITIVKEVTADSGTFGFSGDLGSFSISASSATPGQQQFTDLPTGAYSVTENVPAGWKIVGLQCTDPDNGTAIVEANHALIDLDNGENVVCTFRNAPDGAGGGEDDIFVSPSRSGTFGGQSVTDGDIIVFRGNGNQELFFDGSDVGISKIEAFAILDDDSILLSVGRPLTLSGVGPVKPQDIVRFRPTSTGPNTAGSFEMYFDGSDVYLTAGGEAIDAIAIDSSGKLIISTTGNANVLAGATKLAASDEDLLAITLTSVGASTSGTWSMYFDGSDVGLTSNDIDAAWIDTTNGEIYLSIGNPGLTVGGIAAVDETVFICAPTSLGDDTGCNYRQYFDARDHGFSRGVDGLHIQR